MRSSAKTVPASNGRLWTGRLITILVVLFLVFDGVIKFVRPAPVLQAFAHLGLPEHLTITLGILLLAITCLFAVPRTSLLGAVLLTGYLGGGVAIHLRADDPLFSHVLFPVYLGVLAWAGLILRDDELRAFLTRRGKSFSN